MNSTKSVGQYFLPLPGPSQCGLPEVANSAVSYCSCNRGSSSGSSLSATLPEVPTSATSNLLKNLYLAENPWTRFGRCHTTVLRYFQCASSAFHIVRRFFGCSKTIIEKSVFCTLATLAIQRSEKF